MNSSLPHGVQPSNASELLRRLDAALRAAWDRRELPASVIPADLAQAVRAHLDGVAASQNGSRAEPAKGNGGVA